MKPRVLTALALAPIVVGAMGLESPWPISCLAVALAFLGQDELSRLLAKPFAGIVLGSSFLLGVAYAPVWSVPTLLVIGTSIGALGARFKPLWPIAGLWVASPMVAAVVLHLPDPGQTWSFPGPLVLVVLSVWSGDIAAMLVGKRWGRHPMAPAISPGKTWEGAAANLLTGTLTAAGLGQVMDITIVYGTLFGVAIGIFSQLGDLFESALKRAAGVKDSGTRLPGHGGVLDRIDGLLFALPVALVLWAYFRP